MFKKSLVLLALSGLLITPAAHAADKQPQQQEPDLLCYVKAINETFEILCCLSGISDAANKQFKCIAKSLEEEDPIQEPN